MDDFEPPRQNLIWTLAGLLALGTGIIGIVLPVLPTTPLVLLAAFCFGKGSPRLRAWIIDHAHFGPMIHDWQERGAIPPRAKRAAVVAMLGAFGLSLALGLSATILIIQAVCLSGAATFVLTRPSA
ncbi:DUF454 domain-containing protein [Aliishimia ponticola]|uniref:DUF454 domain-containing protein n=1 Tax=Aliishimia ponticola TaxID=2499833 RepID=A0A4S4NEV9_9RHOB|nr:YbaN family protein [Aliishimia ponticola]THH37325.1 DUF454 domain-containing protein [Aliishimia ponticola]